MPVNISGREHTARRPVYAIGLAALCAVATGGCKVTLERTEGTRLDPAPPRRDGSGWVYTGEGEAGVRADAIRAAEVDARRQASESIVTHVRSEVERVITTRATEQDVEIDDRFASDIRTVAEGAVTGSRRLGKPYVEHWSDARVLARVEMAVPLENFNAKATAERVLRSQALGYRAAGDLARAAHSCWALAQLRPADPVPFVLLARIAEQSGDTGEALEHLRRAVDLKGGKTRLEAPGEGRIDLAAEIDRLTPHWENLLALLAAREEARPADARFGITSPERRYSRGDDGGTVEYTVHSREERFIALLWVDADGVFPLEPFTDETVGSFSRVRGLERLEQDAGTRDGPVKIVAVSVSEGGARTAQLRDVPRQGLVDREREAVEAERALRNLLEREEAGGSLRVASVTFEIRP